MCGIVTIVSLTANLPEESIGRMVDALGHRGPDACNTLRLNGCHLGHTRLSIIDLAGGVQPMSDRSGRYSIVFNGEIYNYRTLRQQLEQIGHRFQTQSDTEVLLNAYIAYGESALSYLNGQFAFAIWDARERKLWAARDRMGEKPLYYARTGYYLLIASEIKAILAASLLRPQLDRVALDAYVSLLYVPPDRTIYNNIHTLRPAHSLTYQDGELKIERYWQPRYSQNTIEEGDAIEGVRTLLARAVERQMVADVPVGAFLSGGLDSTTIVALMSQYSGRKVQTFSAGFGELINELPYARAVAQKYDTDHAELQMDIAVGELLEKMATVYDEPFADSSNIPTYLIAKFASREVKVVLSGDGGDELFGGYEWYVWLLEQDPSLAELKFKQLFWRILAKSRLPFRTQREKAVRRYYLAGLKNQYIDHWERHLAFLTSDANENLSSLRNEESKTYLKQFYYPPDEILDMDRVTYFDIESYLPGDILVKVDRATMAHGLESRSPFLDVDLVEFVLNLPHNLRFRDTNRKELLRQAYSQMWPIELQGRDKQGFGAPIQNWLERQDVEKLKARIAQADSPLTHLFPKVKENMRFLSPQNQWTMLCLGLWLEQHPECLTHPQ